MKRLSGLAIVTVLLVLAAVPARADTVRFPSGQEQVAAYLARPAGPGPFPAVVVIHEWWGLDDWIRAQADALAKRGYVALAVDLYRGRSTKDPAQAKAFSQGLPRERALRDLRGALDYLESQSFVRANRIGSLGWCMGGAYSLDLAAADPRVHACVVVYGRLIDDPARLSRLKGPVLGIFGTEDQSIPPDRVRAFWDAMARAGQRLEVHDFLGASHAFMNPSNKKGHDAAAARTAGTAIERFLDRELLQEPTRLKRTPGP